MKLWAVTAGQWADYAGWGSLQFVGVYDTEGKANRAIKRWEKKGWEAWADKVTLNRQVQPQ